MSRSTSNVQTLFVSASVLALAVSARPISDPGVLTQMGTQAQQVSFDLLSHIHNSISHATVTNPDVTESEDKSPDHNDATKDSATAPSPASVLERLVTLAGTAPAALVESWSGSRNQGAAVSIQSGNVDDETTIFVFTASDAAVSNLAADDPKPNTQMSRIIIPPGSGGTPLEIVFTDALLPPLPINGDVSATAAENESTAAAKPKHQSLAAKNLAEISPFLAPTMLTLLSLGVVLALIAIYHSLGFSKPSRKVTAADLEAAPPAPDSKPSGEDKEVDQEKQAASDEEKAAAELAEKILQLMPPPAHTGRHLRSPRARSPRLASLPIDGDVEVEDNSISRSPSPYLTPRASISEEDVAQYPDPEDLELLVDFAAQTLPQLMPGSLDSQEFADIQSLSIDDVAAIVRTTGPDPVLPLQIAMLFPYLNDGWVLKFFVVLFGWWSVVLSPGRATRL
ncbi:hypothetical protein BKA62DRAFT_765519 [Auriculariales sp. MPI-PUGE-AT-0066]|nr:hypothetical protein BKA62DRAFT_765519 [Auriculariales sp. MPI-PUGE-AT-0066]